MKMIEAASKEAINGIIVNILSGMTLFEKDEISEGLKKCTMFKLDDILRAVIKTPIRDYAGRTVKLLVITKHLGEKAAIDNEIRNLILTDPDTEDMIKLTALFMFSNKEKMRDAIQAKTLFITHSFNL